MNLDQLKQFLRARVKVTLGGPAGLSGGTRGQGLLDALTALAEFASNNTGTAPTAAQLQALLEAGPGIAITPAAGGKLTIASNISATPAPPAPAAPTQGQVDDTADTFSGLLVPGFPAVADYEVFGAPGFPGVVNAAAAGADVQNGRLYSRGLTGSLLIGGAGIRVAASGNRPAGAWLLSDKPFTGSGSTNPGTGVPANSVDLLAFTTDQLDEVMALDYDDCDADPAASPSWSRPGMQFDALCADGKKRHFYCARGTYDPNDSSTGMGPAWHCQLKIDQR